MIVRSQSLRLGVILAACVFIVLFSAVNISRFMGKGYRQDEAVILNLMVSHTPFSDLLPQIASSVTLPAYFFTFSSWVRLFGQQEEIVRLLPLLLGTLTLSLIFRLAADLFDPRAGLIAIFILGGWPLYQAFGYEIRPYSLLILGVAGTTWAFLRWIQSGRGLYAVIYVGFGMIMVNTHLFGMYVPLGHFVTYLLLVRWDQRRFFKVVGVLVAVYVSFAASVLIVIQGFILHRAGSEGQNVMLTTSLNTIPVLVDWSLIRPLEIGIFLLASALFIPLAADFTNRNSLRLFRWLNWKKGYVFVPVIVMFMTIGILNSFVPHLTPRYLIILVPGLTLAVVFALRHLPGGATVAALAIIAVSALSPNLEIGIPSGRHREMVAAIAPRYQPDSRFIIESQLGWPLWGYYYYITNRLPEPVASDRLLMVTPNTDTPDINVLYPRPTYFINQMTASTPGVLEDFVNETLQVWYIQDDDFPTAYGAELQTLLKNKFILYQTFYWKTVTGQWGVQANEYRRIPSDLAPSYRFGDDLILLKWELDGAVQVEQCQKLRVQSWWQAKNPLPLNYSAGLYLVQNGSALLSAQSQLSSVQSNQWAKDDFYLDERELDLRCDIPPGQYDLVFGVYDWTQEPVVNLAINTADNHPTGNQQLYLTTVYVNPAPNP
ncbi:MAG TPA: glycosyltransferase family 39 protein [Phototrophicaceae bacterium]|nr:glycosyltransferase family 39 protein [Phototrophicaceae bacterium]